MHLGFKEAGFETARVVDSNPDAIHTITDNIQVPVYTQDVRRLLQKCSRKDSEMRTLLGPIHHIHSSSQCGGSSTLNRVGGAKAKKDNELSGVLIEFVQLFEPFTATFENVPGILREKNRSYLIRIIVSLLKFGYQVRWCVLKACNSMAILRHGPESSSLRRRLEPAFRHFHLLPMVQNVECDHPWVTVRQAIDFLKDATPASLSSDCLVLKWNDNLIYNNARSDTKALPEDDDADVLQADSSASTIRASSRPPFHYSNHDVSPYVKPLSCSPFHWIIDLVEARQVSITKLVTLSPLG